MKYESAELVSVKVYEEEGYIYTQTLTKFKKEDTPIVKIDDCPHQEIIDIYHRVLSECPKARKWTPRCQAQLRSRWREDKAHQTLEFWEKFFKFIRESKFLMGRTQPIPGKQRFVVTLRWIVTSENFSKIIEGNYHRD